MNFNLLLLFLVTSFLTACGASDRYEATLPALLPVSVPVEVVTQSLHESLPLENSNLQIVAPFTEEGLAVVSETFLEIEESVSPWRYQQWNNTFDLAEAITMESEGRFYRETPTALLELDTNTAGQYRVRLGGDNREQQSTEKLPDGACHHEFGGTNYFLFLDLESFPSAQQSGFWGWLIEGRFELESLLVQEESPCDLNLAQGFIGLIFKVDKADPRTLFYQIQLADSREANWNHFNFLDKDFFDAPTICLLGRDASQFQRLQQEASPNTMLHTADSHHYQIALPFEQLQHDFTHCFPQTDPSKWFIESIYYGMELDGMSQLQMQVHRFELYRVE